MQSYKHVVIVGIDGAGSFFRQAETPNIDRIFKGGALTYNMRVTSPTSSCPSWASCLHGVNPEHHGLIENYFVETFPYPEKAAKYPSFLKVVKAALPDSTAAAVYQWIGINGLVEDDAGIFKRRAGDKDARDFLVNEYLKDGTPTVLYVHLGYVDSRGHVFGYGSPEHLNEIKICDGYVGDIYNALIENGTLDDTLFIVTSDHGGIDHDGHGGLTDDEKYAILALVGKTVEPNGVPQNAEIRDVAAIVLKALGIEQPDVYTARVPDGVFKGVSGLQRPKYYDPDSPRLHYPAPTRDTVSFVKGNIDKPLSHYFSFDGKLNGFTPHGDLKYTDGYFGEALMLDDGYISLDGFDVGCEDLTLAVWLKTPSCHEDSPLFSNRKITKDNTESGFTLSFVRNTYVCPAMHHLQLDIILGGKRFSLDCEMADNYQYGWVHLVLVIDRKHSTVSIYQDFELKAKATAWLLRYPHPLRQNTTCLSMAQDITGTHPYKVGLEVDELLIFPAALSDNDVCALKEFYPK